jgi:hypothetical protein
MYRYLLAALGGPALALFIERQISRTEPAAPTLREYDDTTLAQKVMT